MDVWQTILLAVGGNAALLAVLGLLGKSLLEKVIARDTKLFESQLKAKTDAEIERLKNEMNRNVESYKIQLKKSEIFFEKELEAASTFSSLVHSILPSYNNPMMEWSDVCDAIALSFGKIEVRLDDFMSKHGADLTQDERRILTSATSDAGYGKFNLSGGEVDAEENKRANDMYEKLQSLERQLMKRVRDQASL